jgi:hypothetical protein
MLTTWHLLPSKVCTNFADKRRSLGSIVRLWTQAREFSFFSLTENYARSDIFNIYINGINSDYRLDINVQIA